MVAQESQKGLRKPIEEPGTEEKGEGERAETRGLYTWQSSGNQWKGFFEGARAAEVQNSSSQRLLGKENRERLLLLGRKESSVDSGLAKQQQLLFFCCVSHIFVVIMTTK